MRVNVCIYTRMCICMCMCAAICLGLRRSICLVIPQAPPGTTAAAASSGSESARRDETKRSALSNSFKPLDISLDAHSIRDTIGVGVCVCVYVCVWGTQTTTGPLAVSRT